MTVESNKEVTETTVLQNKNNCTNKECNGLSDNDEETRDDNNESENSINEIIPKVTDNLLSNQESFDDNVANTLEVNKSETTIDLKEKDAPNFENMAQDRIFEIKEYILTVLKYILLLIFAHNCLGFLLCAVFLFTEYYLFFLYTFLGSFAPVLLLSCISIKWDPEFEASTINPVTYFAKHFLAELVKYKHYIQFKKCQKSLELFKEANNLNEQMIVQENYKDAIRNIEDLRLYTATNAILQGSIQSIAQIWVLIHIYDNIYILSLQIIVGLLSMLLIATFIFIYRSSFCDFRNDLGIYRVSIIIHFITMMSMLLYIFDIVSDLIVTIRYFYFEHFIRGTITLIFIIVPGIYDTWHVHYRKNINITFDFKIIITMIFNLNPLIGYQKSMQLLLKTRKAEIEQNDKHQIINYLEYIKNNFHVAYSRYSECFTESCSQLIIQLSFLLTTINFASLQNEKFNILSSVISVLNVAVSVALFFRSKRIWIHEEDPLPILGMFLQFVGYLPVASRIVALSFLASVHPIYTFISMFLHWLMIFLWIIRYSFNQSLSKQLNNGGQAYIHTFTPAINTAYIETIFQLVFFLENVTAMLVWGFSKYGRLTTNAIFLLTFAIVLPSVIGWFCRYLYRMMYGKWIEEYTYLRDKRNLNIV